MDKEGLGWEERILLGTICCLLAAPFILTAVLLATIEDPNAPPTFQTDWPMDVLDNFEKSYPVLWMAPFFTPSGYGTEALSFVAGLEELIPGRVQIRQFGDDYSDSFTKDLPQEVREHLQTMHRRHTPTSDPLIAICHSVPPGWMTRCPPRNSAIKIGRTMFETDSVPTGWVSKLNAMDQIWVPTKFHVETFSRAGVDPSKIIAIPEAIDTDYFDPNCYLDNFDPMFKNFSYVFLSVFKLEERKGWKILIESFLEEFSREDNVLLYVLSRSRGKENAEKEIQNVQDFYRNSGYSSLPTIIVFSGNIKSSRLPTLYKSVNAFVLPSKGEGWGRPLVEAMSMERPSIATFWSGPTEFMTPANSYPLNFTHLESADKSAGPGTKGHQWAVPSKSHLRQLMRHLTSNPQDGIKKGKQARLDLLANYTVSKVAEVVAKQLEATVRGFVEAKRRQAEPKPEEGKKAS